MTERKLLQDATALAYSCIDVSNRVNTFVSVSPENKLNIVQIYRVYSLLAGVNRLSLSFNAVIASFSILETKSAQVGISWISPMT